MSKKLAYSDVERFTKAEVPQEIGDDILEAFAKYSIEQDMTQKDLTKYFEDIQLPRNLYKMISPQELLIEGTDVVDFDKLVRCTYHLLIFMDNQELIDEVWGLLIRGSGRDVRFPNVELQNHVLSVKDLQKASSFAGITGNNDILGMMACATGGKRVYLNYLDFANILGKLGYLKF